MGRFHTLEEFALPKVIWRDQECLAINPLDGLDFRNRFAGLLAPVYNDITFFVLFNKLSDPRCDVSLKLVPLLFDCGALPVRRLSCASVSAPEFA
jgi:hypothetical protein